MESKKGYGKMDRAEGKTMHQYFSEEVVLNTLGGLQHMFRMGRKDIYRLKTSETVVIRNNEKNENKNYYWYHIQRDLLYSSVQYVVCVAGYEGIYKIPMSIISDCAEKGHLSFAKGAYYILVLQRYSGKMCLRLTSGEKPIVIDQFQIYNRFYEKTNEIATELAASLTEGAKKTVIVNAYERNANARKTCIEYYGAKCQVCGFSFAETYGSDYEGLIEVHHIIPISSIQSEYTVDPIKDLIPLCPNCHTAIHKRIDDHCLTVEELRDRVASIQR